MTATREYWNYSTDHLPTYSENLPTNRDKPCRSKAEAVRECKRYCRSEGIDFDEQMVAEIQFDEDME